MFPVSDVSLYLCSEFKIKKKFTSYSWNWGINYEIESKVHQRTGHEGPKA